MMIRTWSINKMTTFISIKFFVFLTVTISFFLYLISIIYGIPLVYLPENISTFEFVSYHILAIVLETALALFLFIHMLVKSKVDFQITG